MPETTLKQLRDAAERLAAACGLPGRWSIRMFCEGKFGSDDLLLNGCQHVNLRGIRTSLPYWHRSQDPLEIIEAWLAQNLPAEKWDEPNQRTPADTLVYCRDNKHSGWRIRRFSRPGYAYSDGVTSKSPKPIDVRWSYMVVCDPTKPDGPSLEYDPTARSRECLKTDART